MRLSQTKVAVVKKGLSEGDLQRLRGLFFVLGSKSGEMMVGEERSEVLHIDTRGRINPAVTRSSLSWLKNPECNSTKVSLDGLECLVADFMLELNLVLNKDLHLV